MPEQNFIIQRYDPDNERSYSEQFALDVQPGQTVLDCLNAIKWEQDGTLSFRMSCRHAICGSCAMKVNGRSMLACQTQVSEALELGDPIRVGPMGNQTVIKDLVVDTEKFVAQFERAETWLEPYEDQEPPSASTARPSRTSTTGRTPRPASTAAPATPIAPSPPSTKNSSVPPPWPRPTAS